MPRTPQNRKSLERFDPVPHTEVDTERLLADPLVKAEYAALEDEYAALRALLNFSPAARHAFKNRAGPQ